MFNPVVSFSVIHFVQMSEAPKFHSSMMTLDSSEKITALEASCDGLAGSQAEEASKILALG